ncbi:MAG: sensor histidine kinase [Oscillospiraceae bacterium]
MKKLKYNFVAKVTAVFLFAFGIMGGCLSGACIIGAYILEFYKIPAGTSYEMALNNLLYNGYYTQNTYDALSVYHNSLGRTVFSLRYWAIALFAIALILVIVLFIFLMCAAGRKEDQDEVYLGFFDRIPLDISLTAAVLSEILLVFVLWEYVYYGWISSFDDVILGAILTALIVTAAFLILLSFLYTFAARVKAGKWWRNSIIYMVLRFVFRCMRGVWRWAAALLRAIPIVWKTALATAAVFIFLAVISYDGLYYGFNGMLFFVTALLVFAAAVLAAFQMKKLKEAGEKLAMGDFDYKTNTDRMFWDFKRHAENLNSTAEGMTAAVEYRMRSERLKTELITNVSHDIKTPLTNIVNYVDLLQKEHTAEQESEYLEVLARQSARLKKLTVDLVEASKASTGNIAIDLQPTNTGEIINQAVAEYAEKFSAGKLEPVVTLPEKPISVMADGRYLWRVLDNLFNNAVKYAQPGTRIYVDVTASTAEAIISVKNISRDRLNVSADELMERFVRGDTSRHTEGSGLGLSIARSLTELMGGSFNISIDGDLFKAKICLKTA